MGSAHEALLASFVERASSAWPGVTMEPLVFVEHLALHAAAPLERWLEGVEPGDSWLACACATGNGAALAAFEAKYFPEVAPTLERTGQRAVLDDDFLQALRERLFAPREEGPPRIATYSGRGALAGWFKMAFLRLATNQVTRAKPEPQVDAALGEHFLAHAPTPEREVLAKRSKEDLKALLAEALASLELEQRVLLRQVFLDGLRAEQLAGLYHVHRTSVTRRVASACEALRRKMRETLRERLDDDAASSLLRVVEGQLSVSLDRLLEAR